jgi:hypothetical protein
MTFLQPILLWGLPAVLLPVLIHLLNRLRYRSVRWAAMMFLLSATRSSTQNAKLRHYLLMACRMLIVFLIIAAMSRPLAGGWLGSAASGAPDTVILLLDRSASMETTPPDSQISKRARALKMLSQSARHGTTASRFVLIESVLRTPQEIHTTSTLETLTMTAPTDTAADIPAMFRAALEYIIRDKAGHTEIWVASDFQQSNWKPDSTEWATISAQLEAMSRNVRLLVLDLASPAARNRTAALESASRRQQAGRSQLGLVLNINASTPDDTPFPMVITMDGIRSQMDLSMKDTSLRYTGKLELSGRSEAAGWGMAEIPADANSRDNTCYFAYGAEPDSRILMVADNVPSASCLRAATMAGNTATNRNTDLITPADIPGIRWDNVSLLIWQAAAPDEPSQNALQTFVERGGTVLCLPPGRSEKAGPFGMQWGRVESAPENNPFKVTTWEEYDGPLARTESGSSLPVAALSVLSRQGFTTPPSTQALPTASTGIELASFTDGTPFLQRRRLGSGLLFICTTLPQRDWSNLGDGTVLVPMIHRLIRIGSERMSNAQMATCGEWNPTSEQDIWTTADRREPKDFRWQTGVYQCGARRVALNRPAIEDLPETLDRDRVKPLLPGARIQFIDDEPRRDNAPVQSEIWHWLIYLGLIGMATESLLLYGGNGSRRSKPATPPSGNRPT